MSADEERTNAAQVFQRPKYPVPTHLFDTKVPKVLPCCQPPSFAEARTKSGQVTALRLSAELPLLYAVPGDDGEDSNLAPFRLRSNPIPTHRCRYKTS